MTFRPAESHPIFLPALTDAFFYSVNIQESRGAGHSCMPKVQRYPFYGFWTFSQAIESFRSSS